VGEVPLPLTPNENEVSSCGEKKEGTAQVAEKKEPEKRNLIKKKRQNTLITLQESRILLTLYPINPGQKRVRKLSPHASPEI